MGQPLGRRALLLGTGGLLMGVAGCSGSPSAPASASASRSGSPAPSSSLPATTPWRPDRDDIDPAVKLRAVQVVEAIGAWAPGQGGAAAAKKRVAALGAAPSLVDQAGPLLPGAPEAALQVIDAQYGGILADSASVLVVCRQWTPGHAGGTTVDVRLSRAQPRWDVTALHPARPGAAAASLPDAARRVLAESRILLPPAAEADIRSGKVHPSVLRALLRLAGTYRMYVSVVRSGHPLNVFGTSRPSDHPRGRAFDVWQIDGHRVVDPATSRRLVESFMRDAAAAGSYNVGGPVRLSGGAPGQFFTDNTHHDHVHAGFTT
ncbi:hypothetical protein OIE62_35080 [Streptomyces scopuliridis]|uniref:Uncharacterized protein n=1 Tax=Streptomyces scopuliridis TaxID=452529 RepID=A0ACD4ZEW8_9ACTN|nr:hypothetical protein [Streptomyces scopuliridis]WSB96566.1 hypothetical protein OG835_05850 [Streptomyces scopuliridis]WSC09730.1 hypothetical protein OIE62_35080 [Streptomyces scopuliridis]